MTFDNVEVGQGDRLLATSGPPVLDRVLQAGYAGIAARQCGLVEEVFSRTVDYLRQRKQFDRPIGSFQALQHRTAAMFCEIENAWSATVSALAALDASSSDAALKVSVAKAKSAEVATDVVAECLQLHGGIGMTDEFDIGLFLKQARIESEYLGGYSYHADRVARLLGY